MMRKGRGVAVEVDKFYLASHLLARPLSFGRRCPVLTVVRRSPLFLSDAPKIRPGVEASIHSSSVKEKSLPPMS